MGALETALRVIEWAGADPQGCRPPPPGDLRHTEQLGSPTEEAKAAVGALAALAGARLRLGNPPLNDRAPAGVGSLLLAAAVGSAELRELADFLLRAMPAERSWSDRLARHAVIMPALRYLPAELGEVCLRHSSLSAALTLPLPGDRSLALATTERMCEHPDGRQVIVSCFASPRATDGQRLWRAELLGRWRLGGAAGRGLVLDIYEAAMVHHEKEILEQTRGASRTLSDLLACRDEERLRSALALGQWWGPLWHLDRSHLAEVRDRPYLGYSYREGLRLYRTAQSLVGGA